MTDRPCPVERCGAALPPGAVICRGCAALTRLFLREVPALLVELDVALSRQTSMPSAGGLARCERQDCPHDADEPGCVAGVRLDVDERASDARTALVTCLHGWALVWDEETPHLSGDDAAAARARMHRDDALSTTVGQAGLLAGLPDLGSRPWAAGLAQEVRDAVEEGWRAVDRPPDSTVVGRCPECSRALYGPEGADLVRCRNCGTTCNRVEVREASLAESRMLVTIVQLADAIGVPERTARSWVTRGSLVRVRYNMDGRPLYRVSDGQALKARGEDEQTLGPAPVVRP